MIIETKFSIGDKVNYIGYPDPTTYSTCECCGQRVPHYSSPIKLVGTVQRINLTQLSDKTIEQYIVSNDYDPRSVTTLCHPHEMSLVKE